MKNLEKIKPYAFLAVIFIICLAFSCNAQGYDFDLWARLIVGKAVIQTGSVLTQDFLSYTDTHMWIDHEWGSSVVFYIAHHLFGAAGIILAQAVLTFLVFVFVYKTIEVHAPEHISKYNVAFYFVGFFCLQEVFDFPVRCHMFTFAFFAMFIYILELARIKNINKPLILIPFVTTIWANMHGGVIAGIGLVLLYAIGELISKKPFAKYLIVFACMIPMIAINPYGLEYYNFLFDANTMNRADVIEWWGLFSPYYLTSYIGFKLFALAFLCLEIYKSVRGGFSYEKADKTKILLLLATFYFAFEHVKLVRFFMIYAMIFGYLDYYELFRSKNYTEWKNKALYILVLIFCGVLLASGSFKTLISNVFPMQEVKFIKENEIKGNVLVNMGIGSFVAYKLYPNNLIFMDGRYEEVYNPELVTMLKKLHLVTDDWDAVLKKYPTDIMILENGYPIVEHLKTVKGWNVAYQGEDFTVFVTDKVKKDKYIYPPVDTKYYEDTLFNTSIDFRKKNYAK